MATIAPTWTENISVRSAATLAAGATEGHDIDLDTDGYDRYEAQVDITIGSSTGVTVNVYGSSDSGTTDDSTPLVSYTVTADDRRTLVLSGAHRRIELVNDDGSNATGNIAIIGAGRKWSST